MTSGVRKLSHFRVIWQWLRKQQHTRAHTHTHLGSLSYQYQRLWCVSSLFWGMTSGNPFYRSFNISLLNSKHISKHTLAFKTEQTAYKVCILFSLSLCLSLTHAHTHTHTPEQRKGEPRCATWLAWEKKKGSYANNGHHSDTMLTFSDGGLISFSMLLIGPEQTATKPQVPHHTQKSVS